MESQVIGGIALAALGGLAMVLALIEVALLFSDGFGTVRTLVGKLTGRGAEETDMQNAMFWIQVGGLFVVGSAMLALGLSIP